MTVCDVRPTPDPLLVAGSVKRAKRVPIAILAVLAAPEVRNCDPRVNVVSCGITGLACCGQLVGCTAIGPVLPAQARAGAEPEEFTVLAPPPAALPRPLGGLGGGCGAESRRSTDRCTFRGICPTRT